MKQHTHKLFLLIQIFCLAGFMAGAVSGVQPDGARDACPDPVLVNTSEIRDMTIDDAGNITLIDEETQKVADGLAGTCPKGFCCSCATCPLFSDIDGDMFCDRGEEPDMVSP